MKLPQISRTTRKGDVSVLVPLILVVCCLGAGWFFWISYQKKASKAAEKKLEEAQSISKIGEEDQDAKSVEEAEPEVVPEVTPEDVEPKVVKEEPEVVVPEKVEPEVVKKPEEEKPKVKTEVDLLLEKKFPLPHYKSLEVLVKNWQEVPQKAFPKQVQVHVSLNYQGKAGGESKMMESEHLAKPLALKSGQLTVVSLDDPQLKATVSLDDTDFKDRVRALYEQKKEEGIAKVLAKRELNRSKAEAYLQKQKSRGEQKKTRSSKGGHLSQSDYRKYGHKFRGDYWPEPKNGKNSEYDHEVPMGPICGVASVLYLKKEAKIVSLWKKGPGARAGLKEGDVLIAVGGKPFKEYGKKNADGPAGVPEALGLAMIKAQAENRPLELTVLRGGEKKIIKVELPPLPPFEKSMPEDARSQALAQSAAEYLLEVQKDDGLWNKNDYTNAWCGLALLATGNPKYSRAVKKAARSLAEHYDLGKNPSNKELINGGEDAGEPNNWKVCMSGIFLAEYYLATGDKAVLRAIDHCCKSMDIRLHPQNGRLGHGRDHYHLPYGGKGLVVVNVHAHLLWALASHIDSLKRNDWSKWELSYKAVSAAFGREGQVGYNFSARGGSQCTTRSGAMLIALNLTKRNKADARRMGKWLADNDQLFPDVHAMTFIGPIFGFSALKNTGKSSYKKAFQHYRWLFSLIQPVNYKQGVYYYSDRGNSGGDKYCNKRLVGNVMAVIVMASNRDDTLWMFGNRKKNWY